MGYSPDSLVDNLYIAALAIIAVLSGLAVFAECCRDTFIQRLGLIATCMGGLAKVMVYSENGDHSNATFVMICGIAIFAIGTAIASVRRG